MVVGRSPSPCLGKQHNEQDSSKTTERPGGHKVGQCGQRTTAGQEEDKRRTLGWPAWPEDNSRTRRTRGGHRVGQRGERTTAGQGGQEEDTGSQGWPARSQDNRKDKTRTESLDEFRGAASQCGQMWPALFVREKPRNPTVNSVNCD